MEYGTFISVVMPVYNRAHLLPRVAGTVLAQTYKNFELIIVDDVSSDDIDGAVAALNDPRVRLIKRTKNGGAGEARNTGVEAAQYPLIAFHDSDDFCTPDRLELSMRALCALPDEYIGVYGMLLMYAEVTEQNYAQGHIRILPPPDKRPLSGDMSFRTMQNNFMNMPTMLLKREAVLATGGFDKLLRRDVDWDLCLRLTRQGPMGFVPEPLVLSPSSLDPEVSAARVSRSDKQGARSRIRICGKIKRADAPGAKLALIHHYASAGKYLMRLGRPKSARKFFAASLNLSSTQPKLWGHYLFSYLPALHTLLRQKKKI